MNYYQNLSYFKCLFLLLIFLFQTVKSQINDNYEIQSLSEENGYSLIDVVDYNNLKLVVSSSGNIYEGIPPTKVSQTSAKLFEYSSIASLNKNVLLAACLEDSLLAKINIINGEYTSLLQYSDISTSLELTIPENVCSISIFENLVFIAYSIISGEKRNNIVIRVNIKNKDDSNGPIIDTNYQIKNHIYEENNPNLETIRLFACEAIYINNDVSNYRLICVHEIKDSKYNVLAFVINNNFEELEDNAKEYSIYSISGVVSFRLFRIDSFNIRVLTRKAVYDLSLQDNNGTINIIKTKANSNLNAYSATKDLFDYNNNFIISSERYTKNFLGNTYFYYFTINKSTSSNYYKLYLYNEYAQNPNLMSKLLGYYDEINDILVVIFERDGIKYFILQNHKKLFEIDSFSYIVRLKSNETSQIKVDDLFSFSNFGNLQVYSKYTYNSNTGSTFYFGGDNFPSNLINFDIIEIDESINNWYEFNLAFIDNQDEYAREFILSKVYLYVRVCSFSCQSCTEDYYKCDNCRNETFAKKKDSEDGNCYPINMRVEGYIYNSASKMFIKCYDSCQFCKKSSEESSSSEHNCESCKEGYAPSYQYLGNCYKINDHEIKLDKKVSSIKDLSFSLIDSCPLYKINLTGECIYLCPISTVYYKFVSLLNLSEITMENYNKDNYEIMNATVPKYLFNKVCYDLCPLFTITDESNNKCLYRDIRNIESDKNINSDTNLITNSIDFISDYQTMNTDIFEIEKKIYEKLNKFFKEKLDNNINFIENVENIFSNKSINNILDNIVNGDKDIIISNNKTIIQITSTYNQKNNKNHNISTINLGICEETLKKSYNIDYNKSLLILKIDSFIVGLKIPVIQYEVYHPENKSKLDLTLCHNKIEINIPVIIDGNNLYKYEQDSKYYNDRCFINISETRKDIPLECRRKEFIKNNMSLCEPECDYIGYDYDTKNSKCECEIKNEISIFNKKIDTERLYNKFTGLTCSNIDIIKCYYLLYKKENLIYNIGFYIILFIIILFCIGALFFIFKGYDLLVQKINIIISITKKTSNIVNNTSVISKNLNKKNKKKIKRKKKNNSNKKNNPPIKNIKNKNKQKGNNELSLTNEIKSIQNLKCKNSESLIKNINNEKGKIGKDIKKLKKRKINKLVTDAPFSESNSLNKSKRYLNDYELNNLQYNDAINYDKRTYAQYYWSLLKIGNLFLFSFIPNNDYNSMAIKICLFFFSFGLYYTVNALFFTDSTMNKIYEENGEYDFIYQIPKILYSNLISTVINLIVRFLSLSEKDILKIKKTSKNENLEEKVQKTKQCLKIKFVFYYLISFLFLFIFWFYISCFCAVYKNTQIYLIKDTLISFSLSLLYPLGYYLVPALFRLFAFKNNNNCTYKISLLLQSF